MEQKILKSNLLSNEILYNESTEQPIDVGFTLPDFCPDISKIFKCRATAYISSKGLSGKNITIDGNICITLFYADKGDKLCSYEYQYPFSKNLEMSAECNAANLSCSCKCEYINCRAVSGRKVDIHGAIAIFVKVFRRNSYEIISDIDDKNIELRRTAAPATMPMGYSEKYLIIEEEIGVGQGQSGVESVIRYHASPCIKEGKIINDKIIVKGELCVWVLYCPEKTGAPQTVKTVIPFSQIVDMEGITELCECETRCEVAFLEIKPKNSVSGECKSFNVTAKLLISCEGYCANEVSVITDAFSKKHEAKILKNSVPFERICESIKENYHCKKNIELAESIDCILDMWCDIQSCSTRFENGSMLIMGTLLAGIVACDENSGSAYYEKPIDFEYKYPIKGDMSLMRCNPEIQVCSCSYTIVSPNTVELRADLQLNASVYECKTVSLITDISIDENKMVSRNSKAAMIIYFTNENECVWDIARHYTSSVDEIMKINSLESENLPGGKMLLVPMI